MSYKNERMYGFNRWEIIIMTVAWRILLKRIKTDTFVENVL